MKISAAQMKVLQQLASCDEPLVYFGGFWTVPSLEAGMRKDVAPTWYTHANTVKSLEKLGLLKQTGICLPGLPRGRTANRSSIGQRHEPPADSIGNVNIPRGSGMIRVL